MIKPWSVARRADCKIYLAMRSSCSLRRPRDNVRGRGREKSRPFGNIRMKSPLAGCVDFSIGLHVLIAARKRPRQSQTSRSEITVWGCYVRKIGLVSILSTEPPPAPSLPDERLKSLQLWPEARKQ